MTRSFSLILMVIMNNVKASGGSSIPKEEKKVNILSPTIPLPSLTFPLVLL